MAGLAVKILDWLLFFYFLTHIPITLVFDLQLVHKELFPQWLIEFTKKEALKSGEPFLGADEVPVWFAAIVYNEIFVQLPFFFLAVVVFFKQSSSYNWMRVPLIIYSTMAMSFLLPIFGEIFFRDYTGEKMGPKTANQRLAVFGMYFPYMFFPFVLLWRAILCQPMWRHKLKHV